MQPRNAPARRSRSAEPRRNIERSIVSSTWWRRERSPRCSSLELTVGRVILRWMIGRPTPKRLFTEAEYLAMERASDRKHEFYQGEIFAMGGGSSAHNLISIGFASELRAKLKGGVCRVYGSDQRVKVSSSGLYTYPDVSVA